MIETKGYQRDSSTNFVEDLGKSSYQKFIEDKKKSDIMRNFQKQLDDIKKEILEIKGMFK